MSDKFGVLGPEVDTNFRQMASDTETWVESMISVPIDMDSAVQ